MKDLTARADIASLIVRCQKLSDRLEHLTTAYDELFDLLAEEYGFTGVADPTSDVLAALQQQSMIHRLSAPPHQQLHLASPRRLLRTTVTTIVRAPRAKK